jgi:hypothetical protein
MSSQAPAAPEPQIKAMAVVQLIAIVTLALSTVIAATAVSIGLSRAEFTRMTGATAAPIAVVLSPKHGAA